jgi:hypothetical protein
LELALVPQNDVLRQRANSNHFPIGRLGLSASIGMLRILLIRKTASKQNFD